MPRGDRLRLLHVTPYYEDAWAYGGIPRLASALARGLAARGHDVTVCTTDAGDADRRSALRSAASRATLADDGRGPGRLEVRVFPNLSNRLAYTWQAFCPVGLWSFLRRRAAAFDAAHIHGHRHLPGALAARALERAGVPYLVAPNGTAPRIERRRALKWAFDATLGRDLLRRASRILAVSDAERRDLAALGIPAGQVVVVPNPIDLREFADTPPRGRFRRRVGLGADPIVLYLGQLTPRKRLDVLVDALARLGRPEVRLVIAGNDRGLARTIRRRAAARGVNGRVHLTGLLRGLDRLSALVDADVFVYPSEHEVFGLAVFEAILCGTPVVVADDSGCAEHVARVGGGLVVPRGDAAATADAIAQVLGDPGTWRTAAREAAARVRARFASEVVSEQVERVYRELPEGSPEPATR